MANNFCPKCGRQRTSSRFCGGCGNDYGEQSADSGTPLADEPVEQPRWNASADDTRPETPGPAPAPAGPNPFAPRAAEPLPADRWETADTIYAEPAPAPGYRPPPPPAPAFPPAYVAPRRRSGGGKRAAFIAVILLVVLGTGGGAYALVSRSNGQAAAPPSGDATVTAPANTTAPTPTVAASPSLTASASPSPTASLSASATPSPTRTGTVQEAAGVAGNPAAPQVEAFLNRYFNSINTRNYGEYNSLLDAQRQQGDSQSTFDSGYATTKDTNEVLTGITDTGNGSLTANVSFTSHQNPADSPDQSTCDDWQISLFLVPQGASYVMTATPAGYHAADNAC